MKKFTSTDLGGAPIYKSDLKEIFNDEIWAALEAILAPFSASTEGIIVSGCVLSDNGGNFDMTAGIVYLNGEFMRIPAATNQTFTKYIAPATPTNDSRTFADATTHAVIQTKVAELVGSAPGSGQYITISSLLSTDGRRWDNKLLNDTIQLIIDGGGAAIQAGVSGYVDIGFDCEIISARALADQSGDIVVDLWQDTYANYPPTNPDSITASAPVTISAAVKSEDTTLTGWNKQLVSGNQLGYNVDSASSVTRVTISLRVRRK